MDEITGWLLDTYPDTRRGAVLWILSDDGRRLMLHHPNPVTFYVSGRTYRLRQLWKALRRRYANTVVLTRAARKDLFAGKIPVLSVQVENPVLQPKIFYWAYQKFPDLEYFDVDVPFALRHAAFHNTFPLARCRVKSHLGHIKHIHILNSSAHANISLPPIRLMTLAPDTDPEYVEPTLLQVGMDDQQRTLSLRDPVGFVHRLEKLIQDYDPDIILTKWGDTWIFPQVLDWADRHHIAFSPNRDTERTVVRRPAFSYHTYGRVLHRGEQVHLFGRWHIDQTNAVMYGEYKLTGVLEQAAITGLPVQEVARKSPGAGITAMQMISAMRKGILIPFHKQQTENFKTPAQLITSDRGGLVGQPATGIHYHVAGIDFFSMYPQIMARFNISPETITSEHHSQTLRVPGTSIFIDQSSTGFIGESLQDLLTRRHWLKQQLLRTHPLDTRYGNLDARSNALKWLLVVCFGYLGHKHFRWMKIEAHEAVTAFGREVLLQAKEIAEQHGCRVLYFNVDGLYVQKQGATQPKDFSRLLDAVRAHTGLNIALDGIYRWIAFLPSRTNPEVPVANRYFGLFESGKIKVRGIEMRRHDTPPFIHKVQAELLHLLTQVKEGDPLESMTSSAIRLVKRRADDLREGAVPLTDLIVSQRISRDISQYRQPSPAARAAMQLAQLNKPPHAGQIVHFLFIKGETGVLAWRAGAPFQYSQVNISEYLKLLARAASNILQPLGVHEDTLVKLLGITGQLPLELGNDSLFAQTDLPGKDLCSPVVKVGRRGRKLLENYTEFPVELGDFAVL